VTTLPLYLVDAFASRPFTGNPAAVCPLPRAADARWMQSVANEMQQAETAFLHREEGGPDRFALRWFTPACEVALCGHATLASAHVLWERGDVARDATIRFMTQKSGELRARRHRASGGASGSIELDFPAEIAREAAPPAALIPALRLPTGRKASFVGQNRMDWLVEIGEPDGEATLRALAPDLAALATIKMRGVIVTARASGGVKRADAGGDAAPDFVSRFFAPAAGVPEDPVTGSAHCALAPHWCERLGKQALTGYQASARGGTVGVELAGDRVLLRGHAVTVIKGELLAE
jgi:PhzF family phenazine biosynthesis protein